MRARSLVIGLLCVVAGLGAIVAGAYGLATELTRGPTTEEKTKASLRELALRWRYWSAERLFPAQLGDVGDTGFARRLGIAPESDCAKALDEAAARVVTPRGCERVLRATYADSSGTMLATLAVVVMKDSESARAALAAGKWETSGVRPAGFSGTVSARFDTGQEQERSATHRLNYLVLGTGGFADGRPRMAEADRTGLPGITAAAMDKLAGRLLKPVPACEVKEIVTC
ncbi:hypothetical protein [Nonomuraea africana]|uniref:Secreted protein n=1 Tax=Nonomuraea africana TaxID=46171 RepID=A0ABR9KGG6_9ACTN|nr:hypothetical protein [Nonomuraea africana]MBE1561074.1 hypothetical protein [Nonomuraea africana]